ncbi:glycosyltransferase [uncultured Mesonia sp.]|uniref:glycosyltransferase n=1 Tax=uncultured Mesonia sp. TaxID=399731 RepID=UPI00374EE3A8
MEIKYSFIIPVYNRPQEIEELLQSFLVMKKSVCYEIIIVEDGSSLSSEDVVSKYKNQLTIQYFKKENSGPGDSRNFGMQRARSSYFIILDSDVILPTHYLWAVDKYLSSHPFDCFGGPDAALATFTPLQKAINYTMTSMLTTGGIRGKNKSVKAYEPRSFNMGLSKIAFENTGGFGRIHPGEDPDLVQRLKKQGFSIGFIEEAFVYHKRRISWSKFYTQVNKFGKVRPILNQWHPKSKNIVFWFPSLFIAVSLLSLILTLTGLYIPIVLMGFYLLILFLHASFLEKSVRVGFYVLCAVFIQFYGYGLGFLKSSIFLKFKSKTPEQLFPNLFFNS